MTLRCHPLLSGGQRHANHRVPGFTLAESLFAMTLVSFVLLAIIGIMPAGLGSLHDAEQRSAESRICQTLLADYEGRVWKSQTTQPDVVTYFDEQGIATSAGPRADTGTKGATFAVRAMLILRPEQGQVAMASNGRLPGEGSASPFLHYLRIAVTSNALDDVSEGKLRDGLSTGKNLPFVHVYTFLLAKLESDKETAQ
ncbi:MAG: Verru Chthon cassette protein [Verrucomicrobiaceae bacterium]|nr:Verru Chthon cassette protein [Verrucomicrobiaceae bacterium]